MKKYEIQVTFNFNGNPETQPIQYNWDDKKLAELAVQYINEHDKAVRDYYETDDLNESEASMKYSTEEWYAKAVQSTKFEMQILLLLDSGEKEAFGAFWQMPPGSLISTEIIEHDIN